MTGALVVSDLRVRLGARTVLDGLDLRFSAGLLHAVMGSNGAGKSTLLRAIAGLTAHDGMVRLDGAEVARMRRGDRARTVAWLPQNQEVHWPLPVREVVMLGRTPHGATLDRASDGDRRAVRDAMDRTDVTAMADRPVTELSGGERARALLARALATEAGLLLADEPASGLDPLHQLTIMEVLRAEARRGRIVLAVLHDLGLAARFADTVTLLRTGWPAVQGAPEDVLTAGAIRSAFEIEAEVTKGADGLRIVPLAPAR
jgi:iron complex transport system ATP-binding protein